MATGPVPGDSAPDIELSDSSGQPVRLADLWRDCPIVLLFVRHLG